jgi:hypothetical protein
VGGGGLFSLLHSPLLGDGVTEKPLAISMTDVGVYGIVQFGLLFERDLRSIGRNVSLDLWP